MSIDGSGDIIVSYGEAPLGVYSDYNSTTFTCQGANNAPQGADVKLNVMATLLRK